MNRFREMLHVLLHGGTKIEPPWKQQQAQKTTEPIRQTTVLSKKDLDPDVILQKLIETSSIEGCLRAYTSAVSGSNIEQVAIEKIKKLARTFDDWILVIQSISPTSDLGKYALEQLPLTACTFDDWQQVYSICSDSVHSTALEKMAATAHSREEQICVYTLAPEGSAIRASMLSALKSQAKSIDDWTALCESSEGDLQKFAASMVVEQTPDAIEDLSNLLSYNAISDNPELNEKVLSRIRALKLPFDKWISVAEDGNLPDEVRSIALDRLVNDPELATKGFDDWKRLLTRAESGSEFEKHAASMAIAKAPDNNPVAVDDLLGYDVINDDSDSRAAVLEKLRSILPTYFDGWKSLYENTEDDEVKEIARDKMIEGADSVDRLIEVDEAVDESDQDDSFDEKFSSQARRVLVTEEDCRRIVEKFYADNIFFETAFEWLLDNAKTTEQCFDLLTSLIDDWHDESDDVNGELFDKTMEKLLSVATPTELYIMSRLGEDDEVFQELGEKAGNKLPSQD